MSKVNRYELLMILSIKESQDVTGYKEKIKNILAANDFEIYQDNELGKRQLAYPIKKEKEGYYWVPIVEAKENASTENLLIFLKRTNFILRTMIVKYDEEKIKKLKQKEEEFRRAKLEARKRKYEKQHSEAQNTNEQ